MWFCFFKRYYLCAFHAGLLKIGKTLASEVKLLSLWFPASGGANRPQCPSSIRL